VVTGTGMTAATAAQEGVTVVGSSGQLLNLLGTPQPQINDAGQGLGTHSGARLL